MTFREYLSEAKVEKEMNLNESDNTNLISSIIPIIDSIISGYGKSINEHTYIFETFTAKYNENKELYEYYDGKKLAFTAVFTDIENSKVQSYTVVDKSATCEMLFITLKNKGKYKI